MKVIANGIKQRPRNYSTMRTKRKLKTNIKLNGKLSLNTTQLHFSF